MNPEQLLAVLRQPSADANPARAYAAVTRSATPEIFATFCDEGKFQALPYASFVAMDGDELGTTIRINHPKFRIVLEGRHLGPVYEALRTRTAARFFVFSNGLHDPPRPGEPVITSILFGQEKPKGVPQQQEA